MSVSVVNISAKDSALIDVLGVLFRHLASASPEAKADLDKELGEAFERQVQSDSHEGIVLVGEVRKAAGFTRST